MPMSHFLNYPIFIVTFEIHRQISLVQFIFSKCSGYSDMFRLLNGVSRVVLSFMNNTNRAFYFHYIAVYLRVNLEECSHLYSME